MTALGGPGSGPQEGEAHPHAGAGGTSGARHDVAKSRLAGAVTAHQAAVGAHAAATQHSAALKASIAQHTAAYHEQDAKDREAAPRAIGELKAKEKVQKKAAADADRKASDILRSHDIEQEDHYAIAQHHYAAQSASIPRAHRQDDARAQAHLADTAAKSASARAKLSPAEHAAIVHDLDASNAAGETEEKRRAITKGLKNADKHAANHDALNAAVQSGDAKAIERAQSKIENSQGSTLRDALAEHGVTGYSHPAIEETHSNHEEAQAAEHAAASKVDRTARAVRVHQREVQRTAPR